MSGQPPPPSPPSRRRRRGTVWLCAAAVADALPSPSWGRALAPGILDRVDPPPAFVFPRSPSSIPSGYAFASTSRRRTRRDAAPSSPPVGEGADRPEGGGGGDDATGAGRARRGGGLRTATAATTSPHPPPPPPAAPRRGPFPTMPSPLFLSLARSQFELLSNSLVHGASPPPGIKPGSPKIGSMALYLPQENPVTGRLEFVPAATHPDPSSERVFVASGATGVGGVHRPPVLPSPGGVPVLPGFFDARDVIPGYPFVGGFASGSRGNDSTEDDPASAAVDEIPSPDGSEPGSLSVPLLAGLDTIGVLVVWPCRLPSDVATGEDGAAPSFSWSWTPDDKRRAALAAKSLALALSMDGEAASARLADERFRVAVADGLHQVKSPLQALRTFGKLLQRQLAEGDEAATVERMTGRATGTGMDGLRNRRSALRLAEDMIAQGERVADLVEPMDALVGQEGGRFLLRGDVDGDDGPPPSGGALVLRPTDPSRIGDPKFQLPPSMPIPDDSPPEMVFPQDTLGSIVYASQAMSRERGINFDAVGFEPDNEISGVLVQPKHLEEAVSNVLDNAIKYAPCRRKGKVGRSRTPRIKVSLTSNEPPLRPGATIVVEDNGPGIPESERDKVFERGYRCDGTMREQVGGSGLGLAIAREMISRMGGTMDILEEGPDKMDGTAVRVVLFRDPELR